jgi:hypothetical protein
MNNLHNLPTSPMSPNVPNVALCRALLVWRNNVRVLLCDVMNDSDDALKCEIQAAFPVTAGEFGDSAFGGQQ